MSNKRKDEHLKYAPKKVYLNDFDFVRLETNSIVDIELNDISINSTFLNHQTSSPIYINAMTGGTKKAQKINEKLFRVANKYNFPFIFGSLSLLVKDEKLLKYYDASNLDTFLVGNLSANYLADDYLKMKKLINANAMSIHLNIIQELSMTEGDRSFSHLKDNIKNIIASSNYPVLVKETGFGMSLDTINKLSSYGVKYIDVSGRGGTNFSQIEYLRNKSKTKDLETLGISTVDSLLNAKNFKGDLYASGGIRGALDIVKSLVLGAKMVGMSNYFLKLVKLPIKKQDEIIDNLLLNIKKIMLTLNKKNIDELKDVNYKIIEKI